MAAGSRAVLVVAIDTARRGFAISRPGCAPATLTWTMTGSAQQMFSRARTEQSWTVIPLDAPFLHVLVARTGTVMMESAVMGGVWMLEFAQQMFSPARTEQSWTAIPLLVPFLLVLVVKTGIVMKESAAVGCAWMLGGIVQLMFLPARMEQSWTVFPLNVPFLPALVAETGTVMMESAEVGGAWMTHTRMTTTQLMEGFVQEMFSPARMALCLTVSPLLVPFLPVLVAETWIVMMESAEVGDVWTIVALPYVLKTLNSAQMALTWDGFHQTGKSSIQSRVSVRPALKSNPFFAAPKASLWTVSKLSVSARRT